MKLGETQTNKANKAISFLNFSASNYISARILYQSNQLYDAGILSHEAIEKVMKALAYFLDSTLDLSSQHNLKNILNTLIGRFKIDELKGSHELFEYYEKCYSYRYPDDEQPKSFATGTDMFYRLDSIYSYFHDKCLEQINDDELKYLSGVFNELRWYYQSNEFRDTFKIINNNQFFNQTYIDIGKNFWHEKGYYINDSKGVMNFPGGLVVVSR